MADINDRINERWDFEKISKFMGYVRCTMEDKRFFKKYNLKYSNPDSEKVKEIIFERIIKTPKLEEYFFSHPVKLLEMNPSYK